MSELSYLRIVELSSGKCFKPNLVCYYFLGMKPIFHGESNLKIDRGFLFPNQLLFILIEGLDKGATSLVYGLPSIWLWSRSPFRSRGLEKSKRVPNHPSQQSPHHPIQVGTSSQNISLSQEAFYYGNLTTRRTPCNGGSYEISLKN